MKICPFLKLLRSEVSNRPRIFRCWINDPYTFQNRCTSWREAISNFGNFLNTGILLLDAIGLQRSFSKTCRACDRLPCFSILANCGCIMMISDDAPLWSSYVTHMPPQPHHPFPSSSSSQISHQPSTWYHHNPPPKVSKKSRSWRYMFHICCHGRSFNTSRSASSKASGSIERALSKDSSNCDQITPGCDGRSWHPLYFNSWSRCVYQKKCFFVLRELVLKKSKTVQNNDHRECELIPACYPNGYQFYIIALASTPFLFVMPS